MDVVQEANASLNDCVGTLVDAILNRAIGNDTAASSGPLYGALAQLLKAPAVITRESVAGDLTPADYDGHAFGTITWTTAHRDQSDESYVLAGRLTFTCTGHATIGSQLIHGLGIYGSDSVTLKCAVNFDQPVTINELTPVVVDFTLSPKPVA